MAAVAAVAAVASLGYGIYAGERASAAQARNVAQARQDAQQQQAQQEQMLAKQQADAAALQAQQVQAQKDAFAAQQKLQQEGLATAQGQIPGIQAQLGASTLAAEQQAYKQQQPLMEARLNALGLLQSGALPEAQAKYQGQLESQRQQELANYGIQANQMLQQQALGYTGTDAATLQQNLNQSLQSQQAAQQQQFQGQDIAYQNQVAQQQALQNMQMAQAQGQQAQAGQFVGLGGALAGAAGSLYKPSVGTRTPTGPISGAYQPGQNYSLSNQSGLGSWYSPQSTNLGALQYSKQAGLF